MNADKRDDEALRRRRLKSRRNSELLAIGSIASVAALLTVLFIRFANALT
jgi:hypothetical protein